MCGFSEVAKELCGAVGTSTKSQERPACSCSRFVPGAGGGVGCALSGKKWIRQLSKRKQRLILKKVFFFYPQQYLLQESDINHQLLRPHFLKKMIYVADHRPEKNSDEYTESIRWFYLSCDRIIPSAKRVHICWITYLFVSAPHLPHPSIYCRLEQPELVKEWYPSMSVRNAD